MSLSCKSDKRSDGLLFSPYSKRRRTQNQTEGRKRCLTWTYDAVFVFSFLALLGVAAIDVKESVYLFVVSSLCVENTEYPCVRFFPFFGFHYLYFTCFLLSSGQTAPSLQDQESERRRDCILFTYMTRLFIFIIFPRCMYIYI
ncbi:hypothetical protein GGS20DRAFT_570323 [Poronia punctata]|nr:hypothetical protein GGS20DRAFT_570323 [Poronia punctata]